MVDYECETDCETDSENYGDMDDGRKRRHVARKDEWKKNKAKRQRMLGEEYLGYSNPKNDKMQQDRVRAARQIGMTCTSEYCKKVNLEDVAVLMRKQGDLYIIISGKS